MEVKSTEMPASKISAEGVAISPMNATKTIEDTFKTKTFTIYHINHINSSRCETFVETVSGECFIKSVFEREKDIMAKCKVQYFNKITDMFQNMPYVYSRKTSEKIAKMCLDPDSIIEQYPNGEDLEDQKQILDDTINEYKDSITEGWLMTRDTNEYEHVRKIYCQNHGNLIQFVNIDKDMVALRDCWKKYNIIKIFVENGHAHDIQRRVAQLQTDIPKKHPTLVSVVELTENSSFLNCWKAGSIRDATSLFHTSVDSLARLQDQERKQFDLAEKVTKKLTDVFIGPPYCYSRRTATDIACELLEGKLVAEDFKELDDDIKHEFKMWQNSQKEILIMKKDDNSIQSYCKLRPCQKIKVETIDSDNVIKSLESHIKAERNGIVTTWLLCDEYFQSEPPVNQIIDKLKEMKNMTKKNVLCKVILHNRRDSTFITVLAGGTGENQHDRTEVNSDTPSRNQDTDSNTASRNPFSSDENEDPAARDSEILFDDNSGSTDPKSSPYNLLMIGIITDIHNPQKRKKEVDQRKKENKNYIEEYGRLVKSINQKNVICSTWNEISLEIRNLLTTTHEGKWKARIVFNGHGKKKEGLCVLDDETTEKKAKDLDEILYEIKEIYDIQKADEKLIGLDIVFAQCHAEYFTFISDDINFRVIVLREGPTFSVHGTCREMNKHYDLDEFILKEKANINQEILPEKVLVLSSSDNLNDDNSAAHTLKKAVMAGYRWMQRDCFNTFFLCESNAYLAKNIESFFHSCCHHIDFQPQCKSTASCKIILRDTGLKNQVLTIIKEKFCRLHHGGCLFCPLRIDLICVGDVHEFVHEDSDGVPITIVSGHNIDLWAVSTTAPILLDLETQKLWQMIETLNTEHSLRIQWVGLTTIPKFERFSVHGVCSTLQGFVCCGKQNDRTIGLLYKVHEKRWQEIKNWPDGMTTVVSVLGELYVLGNGKECYRYNGERWTRLPDMLEDSQKGPLCMEMLGRLWVIPNTGRQQQNKISLYVLDTTPPEPKWIRKVALPDAIRDVSRASLYGINNELYLLGGIDKCCAVYDFYDNEWSDLEKKPRNPDFSPSFICKYVSEYKSIVCAYEDEIVFLVKTMSRSGESEWDLQATETFLVKKREWEHEWNHTRHRGDISLPLEIGQRVFITQFKNN